MVRFPAAPGGLGMTEELERDFREFVERAAGTGASLEPLSGDGSTRRIFRVRGARSRLVAVLNPLPRERSHPDENESFLAIRSYLQARRIRVPACHAADPNRGFFLLEDLGDLRLYDRARTEGWGGRSGPDSVLSAYRTAVRTLVRMQEPRPPWFPAAAVGNPPYTESFVLEAEARYFHVELVCGLAGFDDPFPAIETECIRLAREALGGGGGSGIAPVFLHRDYQSRNLMLVGPALAVIDFQGGRLGPSEYDLASLLYDPYVAMPEMERRKLIALYTSEAAQAGIRSIPSTPTAEWERRFLANAANRLMQALGAFAKLGGRLGRPGFREHVPQGLAHLHAVLRRIGECPRLLRLVDRLQENEKRLRPPSAERP
ncbi:MAG: phosphotransferase [Candidatus Eisenbacteria bacterium]|nr:phosphotransferase [Candidatus Latescibacterota bacterium]MBD3302800.1 phosphotransferase [Candidatus Eisenbacteria bacterium]